MLALITILIIVLAVLISIYTRLYFIGFVIVAISLSVIAPFFDMPALKKSGKMVYYSPLFIAEQPKNGCIKVHGGTLFDYCFVIDKTLNGKQRTDFIIQQYLSGLLALIENHKTDKHLTIHGTSYILNERTAEKIGFKTVKTDTLQHIILAYNYVNILISGSIAKNKLAFPKLKHTKTFEAEISRLQEHKVYIETLHSALKKTLSIN